MTETLAQRLARQMAENHPGFAVAVSVGGETAKHNAIGEKEKPSDA
jgi:hypothetical protein